MGIPTKWTVIGESHYGTWHKNKGAVMDIAQAREMHAMGSLLMAQRRKVVPHSKASGVIANVPLPPMELLIKAVAPKKRNR